jgi:hypothetical protein
LFFLSEYILKKKLYDASQLIYDLKIYRIMKKLTYLFFVLAMLPMLSIQAGTTRYVKATGSDSNGGTSWATAKLTIASALTASASGDVIYVAKGTYQTSSNPNMVSGVNVYGGYDDATGLRDIVNNKTILKNTGSDARVLNGGNLAVETIWDGFTLTGGTRSSTGAGAQIGTNCVLSNCIISGNDNPGANQYASGGGVYMSGGKLLNCIVENNTCASSGGAGISNPGAGDVIIENCIIRNNKATGANGGGGVILRNNSVIKNCIIANNEATVGNVGGINAYGNSKVINCTVVNNKAFGSSGATYLGGTASIINTILWNNSSATNVVGKEEGVTMTNCAVQASASAGSFLLNASNAATDGPNFVSPSTTIGYTTDDQSIFNWQLSTGSPCINTGTDVTASGVTTDMLGTARPKGGSFDIGAYEFNGTATDVSDINKTDMFILYPNPASDHLTVNLQNIRSVNVYSVTGAAVPLKISNSQIDVSHLLNGIYNFVVKTGDKTYITRIIKK